jgi:hypothetical protein
MPAKTRHYRIVRESQDQDPVVIHTGESQLPDSALIPWHPTDPTSNPSGVCYYLEIADPAAPSGWRRLGNPVEVRVVRHNTDCLQGIRLRQGCPARSCQTNYKLPGVKGLVL